MTKIPAPIIYITAALLFLALAPLPYGYYTFLRIVVTGTLVWGTVVAFDADNESYLPFILGAGAILFNPIIPIYLTREIWSFFNVAFGVFLIIHQRKL